MQVIFSTVMKPINKHGCIGYDKCSALERDEHLRLILRLS